MIHQMPLLFSSIRTCRMVSPSPLLAFLNRNLGDEAGCDFDGEREIKVEV